MRLTFSLADEGDAPEIAALRIASAAHLTERFGRGHWSGEASERGVLAGMHKAEVWLAHRGKVLVGTYRLSTTKPWAIDPAYFAKSRHPLYLTDMAVSPAMQRRGAGRQCLAHAVRIARKWPADAIRLDAYDAEAGAGEFYEKCGFREVGRVSYRGTPLIYFELILLPAPARAP